MKKIISILIAAVMTVSLFPAFEVIAVATSTTVPQAIPGVVRMGDTCVLCLKTDWCNICHICPNCYYCEHRTESPEVTTAVPVTSAATSKPEIWTHNDDDVSCMSCGSFLHAYGGFCSSNRGEICSHPSGASGFCPGCGNKWNKAYKTGHILGNSAITVSDALEILRFLAKIPSELDVSPAAYDAACIVSEDSPAISDALEILKYLAKLDSVL